MLDLFIIRILHLNLLEIRKLNGLIIRHSLHHGHINPQTGGMLLLVLPLIGHMLVRDDWLVVDVVLLDGDVLDVGGGNGLRFGDHGLNAFGQLHYAGRGQGNRFREERSVGGH